MKTLFFSLEINTRMRTIHYIIGKSVVLHMMCQNILESWNFLSKNCHFYNFLDLYGGFCTFWVSKHVQNQNFSYYKAEKLEYELSCSKAKYENSCGTVSENIKWFESPFLFGLKTLPYFWQKQALARSGIIRCFQAKW